MISSMSHRLDFLRDRLTMIGMDPVSGMLSAHRGRDAYLLRCSMSPPWSVRIADASTVSLIVMVHGRMVIARPGEEPAWLADGDVAVVKTAAPYLLASDLETPAHVVVEPGQHCVPLDDGPGLAYRQGLRTWGNSLDGGCVFLAGIYELPSQVSGRLLESVPGLLVLPAGEQEVPGVTLLAGELGKDAPGQDAVLDRLVDLVLITTLRAWFARDTAAAPRWWVACQDPLIGDVLRLMHNRPAEPWTLEAIAAEVAVSRATLARRFTQLLGQPPMAYLTEWRLCLAADLLRDTTQTVESIARQAGYASPFAFTAAFKRQFGQPPRPYRRAAGASG
jgi:AraC-like DNA-binding protein